MYNHFSRMTADQIFAVTPPGETASLPNVETYQTRIPRWHSLLGRFRCRPISDELLGINIASQCEAKIRFVQPDLILTVWHGPFLFAAFRLSRRLKIPLAIVCHDDNEALYYGKGQFFKQQLRRRLTQIYCAASARLCVSEGMREEFERRYGRRGELLYPLSISKVQNGGNQNVLGESDLKLRPLRFGYAGSYSAGCIPILTTLLSILEKRAWQFHFASPTFDEGRESLRRFRCMKDMGVFRPNEVAAYFSKNVDVMVIVQGFSEEERVLGKTNFPSKLVECAQYGLALLVISPSESSAARWVQEHPGSALLIQTDSEVEISEALDLLAQVKLREKLQKNLAVAVSQEFNPDYIHVSFATTLEHAFASN